MNKGTVKQHWIPRFIVKGWTNQKIYKFYNIQNETFGKANLKGIDDIFSTNFLYEDEQVFQFNEIEKGLAKIENDFANLLKNKILNQKEKITLNRLELKTIKLYSLIENYRLVTAKERAIHLQGDYIYNKHYQKMSVNKINQEYLERLHYLVFDVFYFIKENPGFLTKEWEEKWKLEELEIHKMFNKYHPKSSLEAFLLSRQYLELDSFLMNNMNVYSNSCLKIIKIGENINDNFLLTDARSVQFFGEGISKFFGLTILELMPISPRYAIAFLRLNQFDKSLLSPYAKNSFWDQQFPNLFTKNHTFSLYRMQEYMLEIFKARQKNVGLNFKSEYEIQNKYIDNKDLYIYPIYELANKEQVWLINGMLHSQTYKYVCYKKGKDLLKANEAIKKYGIYRVEEANKEFINFMPNNN